MAVAQWDLDSLDPTCDIESNLFKILLYRSLSNNPDFFERIFKCHISEFEADPEEYFSL